MSIDDEVVYEETDRFPTNVNQISATSRCERSVPYWSLLKILARRLNAEKEFIGATDPIILEPCNLLFMQVVVFDSNHLDIGKVTIEIEFQIQPDRQKSNGYWIVHIFISLVAVGREEDIVNIPRPQLLSVRYFQVLKKFCKITHALGVATVFAGDCDWNGRLVESGASVHKHSILSWQNSKF